MDKSGVRQWFMGPDNCCLPATITTYVPPSSVPYHPPPPSVPYHVHAMSHVVCPLHVPRIAFAWREACTALHEDNLGTGWHWNWMSLEAAGCRWMLLDVVGCCWVLVAVTGCPLMSFVIGCRWMLLDTVGYNWISLYAAGCQWMPL